MLTVLSEPGVDIAPPLAGAGVLGIEIPCPHTTLCCGADEAGRAAPAQVLLGKAPGAD